jgi:hypothetical protein
MSWPMNPIPNTFRGMMRPFADVATFSVVPPNTYGVESHEKNIVFQFDDSRLNFRAYTNDNLYWTYQLYDPNAYQQLKFSITQNLLA